MIFEHYWHPPNAAIPDRSRLVDFSPLTTDSHLITSKISERSLFILLLSIEGA